LDIAIIGSGIAGMTCGYLLSPDHQISLFEKNDRLGGHTHTHEIRTASGTYKVDTGFIVFNDRNYPNFNKLMDQLHVLSLPTEMSFSVKVEKSGLEYNGSTINTLFCQRRNFLRPSFYKMISDILRFNKQATHFYLEKKHLEKNDLTIEGFLKEHNYSESFIENYILPMGAAIWSASREEMRRFPLNFFIRFFNHHGLLQIENRPQWRVVQGGSSSYIPSLTKNFKDKISLNSKIHSITRIADKVHIEFEDEPKRRVFDQVIFACHADEAMALLADPSPREKEVIAAFSYRPNDVTLHTDESVLPLKKRGYASWNYFLPKVETERVAVSYNMNILQRIRSPETFIVSLNMDESIRPEKILKKIQYSHPVYNQAAIEAQEKWPLVSGVNLTHFCGAYWGNGFHEDGVSSALRVAKSFGIEL
jgi:uncharacterized protein